MRYGRITYTIFLMKQQPPAELKRVMIKLYLKRLLLSRSQLWYVRGSDIFALIFFSEPPYSVTIVDKVSGPPRNGFVGPYLEGESFVLTCLSRGGK